MSCIVSVNTYSLLSDMSVLLIISINNHYSFIFSLMALKLWILYICLFINTPTLYTNQPNITQFSITIGLYWLSTCELQ